MMVAVEREESKHCYCCCHYHVHNYHRGMSSEVYRSQKVILHSHLSMCLLVQVLCGLGHGADVPGADHI